MFVIYPASLVGLVVASATAEHVEKVLLGFPIRNYSVTVTESGFAIGTPITWDRLKKNT